MMDAKDLRENIKIAEDLLRRKFDEIKQIQQDIEEFRKRLQELNG